MERNLRSRKTICLGRRKVNDDKSDEDTLPNDNQTSEILNDDCLLHIFEYLPISDRIRLERVNKRWCAVSRMSWRNFKVLNFTHRLWGHGVTINRKVLKDILNQCGELLKVWDMSEISVFLEESIHVQSYLKCCPNLKSIDLTSLKIGQPEIRSIVRHCKKLVILKLGPITISVPSWFRSGTVLSALPHLQVLQIGSIHEYRSYHIGSLSGNWINFKNKNLVTELRLDYCRGLDGSNISTAVPQLPNLHTLSLRGSLDFWKAPWDINFITQSNIKTLDITDNPSSIDDNFLVKIALLSERLTGLYIGENPKITDTGLSALIFHSNIECLSINELNITGISLLELSLLKQLSCKHCKRLNANIFRLLFTNSDKLECINLQGVDCVNDIIRIVIEYLKSCKNHVKISIFLDEIDVDITDMPENLKLFKLNNN